MLASTCQLLMNLSNPGSNKRSSGRSIDLVVPVLRGDDDSIIADVVALMADNEDLGGSDEAEALVAIGITKGDDCRSQY